MLSIRLAGLDSALRRVNDLPRQIRFGAARALNETALNDIRPSLQTAMDTDFDRPTPWIKRSIWVDRASPEALAVRIYPRGLGGKGVDPAKVLTAEVHGGARRNKRAERAFQRIGVLPPGWYMVPSTALLGDGQKSDSYGNVKGSFLVQLIAYFNAFGEQGYRANMTDKRRQTLAKVKKSKAGHQQITGVQYFISRGKGTFGALPAEGRHGREQRLPPGIWSRSGTHGSDIKPVFLFVRDAHYAVRYRMRDIVNRAVARSLPGRLAVSVRNAIATAR